MKASDFRNVRILIETDDKCVIRRAGIVIDQADTLSQVLFAKLKQYGFVVCNEYRLLLEIQPGISIHHVNEHARNILNLLLSNGHKKQWLPLTIGLSGPSIPKIDKPFNHNGSNRIQSQLWRHEWLLDLLVI